MFILFFSRSAFWTLIVMGSVVSGGFFLHDNTSGNVFLFFLKFIESSQEHCFLNITSKLLEILEFYFEKKLFFSWITNPQV